MARNWTAALLVAGLVWVTGGGGELGAVDLIGFKGAPSATINGDYSVTSGNQLWDSSESDGKPSSTATVTNVTMAGGTLTVGNASTTGHVEVGRFVMIGGEVTVGGKVNTGTDGWVNKTAFITGGWQGITADDTPENASVSLTGGKLTLLDGGRIQTAVPDAGEPQNTPMIYIGGTVEINMNGSSLNNAAVIKAHDAIANRTPPGESSHNRDDYGWYSQLRMDGGTINVNGYGMILSRETTMDGGTIDVKSGSNLKFAGSSVEGEGDLSSGLNHTALTDNDNTKQWGDFTINGGKIANAGIIDFATYGATLNAAGGELTGNLNLRASAGSAAAGNTYSRNLHVLSGGSFSISGNLDIASGTTTFENKGNLNITGKTESAKTIDLAADSVTNFGGGLTISSGNLVAGDDSSVTAGGDVTISAGGVTLGRDSSLTLNNGSDLTASGTFAVDPSTKLNITGGGSHNGAIDVADMTVGGSNNAGDIANYLRTQSSSGITGSNEYMWDDANKKILYASVAVANAAEGVAAVLNRTGNGRLISAVNSGAADTWAAIINGGLPAAPGTQGEITRTLLRTYLTNVTAATSADEQRAVVSALAGLDAAKSLDVAMLTAGNVAGRIQGRVRENNFARARAGERLGSVDAMASAIMNGTFANRFWVGGFGMWEEANRHGFDSGYEYASGGFIAGYDRIIGPLTVGGSFAYTSGSYEDRNSLDSDSGIDSYAFNLYGTYNHASGFFASATAGYTYSDYDMANLLTRAGQWNNSKFHANTWTFGANLGYDIRPVANLAITPSAGLYYYTSSTSTFTSTIAHGLAAERDSLELPVDLAVNYDIPIGFYGTIRLIANAGYAYSFSKHGGELGSFGYNGIDGSSISGIRGRDNSRHTWNLGAGVGYSNDRLDVGVKYDYYARSDYDAHRIMGTVGISF